MNVLVITRNIKVTREAGTSEGLSRCLIIAVQRRIAFLCGDFYFLFLTSLCKKTWHVYTSWAHIMLVTGSQLNLPL